MKQTADILAIIARLNHLNPISIVESPDLAKVPTSDIVGELLYRLQQQRSEIPQTARGLNLVEEDVNHD